VKEEEEGAVEEQVLVVHCVPCRHLSSLPSYSLFSLFFLLGSVFCDFFCCRFSVCAFTFVFVCVLLESGDLFGAVMLALSFFFF
jgi:hypothetical protein